MVLIEQSSYTDTTKHTKLVYTNCKVHLLLISLNLLVQNFCRNALLLYTMKKLFLLSILKCYTLSIPVIAVVNIM